MRFWLVHSGEVPLQDQTVAQVSLGILSGELAPGERLPSIREIARRFHLHSNTVSLAYRRLEREQWLESRRGSGMYVRGQTSGARLPPHTRPGDRLFLDFARTMLIAAGFHADSLLVRNPAEPGWCHGLAQTAAVVCDSNTVTLLPRSVKAIAFRILADETLIDLERLRRA